MIDQYPNVGFVRRRSLAANHETSHVRCWNLVCGSCRRAVGTLLDANGGFPITSDRRTAPNEQDNTTTVRECSAVIGWSAGAIGIGMVPRRQFRPADELGAAASVSPKQMTVKDFI